MIGVVPCKVCASKSIRLLTFEDTQFWFMCDDCGTVGEPESSVERAEFTWNVENRKPPLAVKV